MKQCLDRLPCMRPAIASVLIGAGVLSGCASATIDDAVPTAASPQAAPVQGVSEPVETALSSGGPKDTGTYPNLNIKPQAAHEQITPEQKSAEIQGLQSAQAAQAARGTGGETTDPELLRKLAATHAEDALKQIEGQ